LSLLTTTAPRPFRRPSSFGLLWAAIAWSFVAASGQVTPPAAPSPSPAISLPSTPALVEGGTIHGVVKSGTTPLPGASVTATNTLTGKKYSTTTDVTGAYAMAIPRNGRYVVRVELAAFAASTKEVLLNAASHDQQADLVLVLASRAAQQDQREQAGASGTLRQLAGGAQNLNLLSAAAGLIDAGAGGGNSGAQLPSLANSSDFSGDSVAVSGQNGTTSPFAGMNGDQMRQNFENMEQSQALSQIPGQSGGQGGGPGGGGPGFFMIGGGGRGGRGGFGSFRNFKPNQPHGAIFWNGGNSALDAQPFALRGVAPQEPGYSSNRFGATFIGAPYIPRLMKAPSGKNIVFLNFSGQRTSSPFDEYGTVPTLAERGGDFSGLTSSQGQPITIYNPATGQPYANNTIASGTSPQAASLLAYIPQPNLPGTIQNYHRQTTEGSNTTTLGVRLVHNFGPAAGNNVPAMVRQFMGGGAPGFHQNINANFNLSHSASDRVSLFPDLGGKQQTHQYSVALGYTLGYGKLNNNFTVNWNRTNSELRNNFTGTTDVATLAGILGPDGSPINPDSLNYGVPNLVLNQFNGLNETQPNFRVNQTISLADMSSWSHGKHNVRFGGDFRRVHLDLLGGTNATGSFYFTGLFTEQPGTSSTTFQPNSGSSFADFLLGLPQETTIQAPQKKAYMRANTWDLFLQDDWRIAARFTVLAGLRYEYFSPYSEKFDRLANLDHSPDFTAVTEVSPNQTGPYSGKYPRGLLNPVHTSFSPRIGFALRPFKDTVLRGGYAINYTNGQYAGFIQDLAYEPPFANVQTNEVTQGATISLANGFPAPQTIGNYGINKNYRLPYVQVWNLDLQRTFPLGIVLNVGYNGAKGTRLSIVDAPGRFDNTSASGVLFNFEDSLAFSNYNALTVRARKRLQNGVSLGATYTYSHSIDNASAVGAAGGVVTQNWQNLLAEESNSSFDQRHVLKGDAMYELPFGPDKHYLSTGSWLSRALGDWNVQTTFNFASGTPMTPSIAAAVSDVSRGTAGSLRPNRVTGASITAGGGSINHWFNTDAFSPVFAPGQLYGTASRYSITGPGTIGVNLSLSKTFQFGETRGLEVRATGNNAFNIVQYAGVNTQYDSPALGEVTSTRSMRQITMMARFRF
jgi:Carboxypeptidase regulatory-like domain/TonB dependent receptor-like, beta-barrel